MVHPSRLLSILRNDSCRALNGLPSASPQPEVAPDSSPFATPFLPPTRYQPEAVADLRRVILTGNCRERPFHSNSLREGR